MQLSYKPTLSAGTLTDAVRAKVFDAEFHEITGVRCESVTHATGAEPNRAELVAVLDSFRRTKDASGVTVSEFRMEDALDRESLSLGLDDEVIVGIPLSGRRVLVLFRGRISDVTANFDADDETVTLTALDPRRMLDASDVRGCVHADPSGAGTVVSDETVVFNRDGVGNLDEAKSYSDDADYPLFADAAAVADDDNPSWLGYWRLSDAWNYLLARYCPEGDARRPTGANAFPLPDEKNPVLPPTDVDGLPPSRAIDRLLSTYGLDWWVDPVVVVSLEDEPTLDALPVFRVLSPGDGPVKSLKLAAAGSTFDRSNTNVEAGSLSVSTRPTINRWIIEGDLAEHEAAFELTMLWTDAEEDEVAADPDIANRAHADYDPLFDHVYRQWGLNEDAHWSDRPAHDFDDLFGEGKWVRRRRLFLPPYTAPGDDARKIVVEVKTSELTSWHRVASGPVRLLVDRAGIYLDLADVDGSASRLRLEDAQSVALEEITDVRVTAIVQCDERVTHEAEKSETSGSTLTFTQTLRRSDFRKVVRDASSVFSPDGTGTIRDDAADDGPMEKAAKLLRTDREPQGLHVRCGIPWIDLTCRPGDRVERMAGRDVGMGAAAGEEQAFPAIVGVRFDFRSQGTVLTLRT
jgi:hypothetical protein